MPWSISPGPGSRSVSEPRQELCVRTYQTMTSNDILPTRCEFGLASFWTKRENLQITSKSVLIGWVTPFECIWVTRTSSRTSIVKLYGHHPRRLWTLSAHSLPTYFDSASCPRRLLERRKIWVYTRMIWLKAVLLLR